MKNISRLTAIPIYVLALLSLLLITGYVAAQPVFAATPPVISVWYGNNQVFGALGLPQKWVNILGNVSTSGSALNSLSYTVNGGSAVPLRVGPDKRRLVNAGDFNIELDQDDLIDGNNTVVISALDSVGGQSVVAVTVVSHRNTWPLPYTVDWSTVNNPQDVVQIVDGKWSWGASGIRPVEVGYDRILGIGDMRWTDYEVTVPATVHSFDLNSPNAVLNGAGFGLVLRWLGHTNDPVDCTLNSHLHCGWNPEGASDWYSFKKTGIDTLAIESIPAPSTEPAEQTFITSRKFVLEHTYMFKGRVETTAAGNLYRLKVWEPSVESEPAAWTITRTATPGNNVTGNLQHGAFLLVAHNVDVTFGNFAVTSAAQPVILNNRLFIPLVANP